MSQPKENGILTSQVDLEISNQNLPAEKKGTHDDQRDMFRMGKVQELRVSEQIRCCSKHEVTDS
jgi:hypothetical protein